LRLLVEGPRVETQFREVPVTGVPSGNFEQRPAYAAAPLARKGLLGVWLASLMWDVVRRKDGCHAEQVPLEFKRDEVRVARRGDREVSNAHGDVIPAGFAWT
jgi:hypothetical protein